MTENRPGNQCVECEGWTINRSHICAACHPLYPDRLVDDVDPAQREPKDEQ